MVTVASRTICESCTSAARAVAAVLPCFSQVTSTSPGSRSGTRRKCALVATGYGSGELSSTARSIVATITPPFTADGVALPGATIANLSSGLTWYRPGPAGRIAVASSKTLMR